MEYIRGISFRGLVAGFMLTGGCLFFSPGIAVPVAHAKAPATLLSPKRDDVVGRTHEVTGKLAVAGQPLVLVRDATVDGEWYIQPAVELKDRGFFRTQVRFGNDDTEAGAKFHIAVVILRTPEEAEFFRGKESLASVPALFVCSEPIPVVLGPDAPSSTTRNVGSIVRPSGDERVATRYEVVGKTMAKGWPVVVVRSDDSNELWWVQEAIRLNDDGTFTCLAKFGNDKTPSGSKFRVAYLMVATKKEARDYAPGMSLEKLPEGILHSEETTVTLDRTLKLKAR